MKRKQLKEEKELRRVIKLYSPHDGRISRLVTALVRAVRENCAATVEAACKKKTLEDKICKICSESAAAIRKGGK